MKDPTVNSLIAGIVRLRPLLFGGLVIEQLLVFVACPWFIAQFTGLFFAQLLAGGNETLYAFSACAALMLVTTLRAALVFGGAVGDTYFVHSSSLALRKSVVRSQNAAYVPLSVGHLIPILRDDVFGLATYASWLPALLARLTFSIVAIVHIYSIDRTLATWTVIPVSVAIMIISFVQVNISGFRERARSATTEMTETLSEVIDARSALGDPGAMISMRRHCGKLFDKRARAAIRERIFNESLNSVLGALMAVAFAALLYRATIMVRAHRIGPREFAECTVYLSTIALFLTQSGGMIAFYFRTAISAQRIAGSGGDVCEQETDRHEELTCSNLQSERNYAGGAPILWTVESVGRSPLYDVDLSDQSFAFVRGDAVAIFGPTGAGKSTVVRGLLGLNPDCFGVWRNTAGEAVNPRELLDRGTIGYLPQFPKLVDASIQENILQGTILDLDALSTILTGVQLDRDLSTFPDGVQTRVGSHGSRLSGGQIKRIALARALASRPSLLVIDDFSSGLDVETESAIWSWLRAQNISMVIATNTKRIAEKCERCVTITRDSLCRID